MQVKTKVADFADAEILKAYRSAEANLNKLGKDLEGQRDRVGELKFRRKAAFEKMEVLDRRRDDLLKAAAQGAGDAEGKLEAFRQEHSKQRYEVQNLDQMLAFAEEALDEKMRQIVSAEAGLSGHHRQLSVNIAENARKNVIEDCEQVVKKAWALSKMAHNYRFRDWLYNLYKSIEGENSSSIGLDLGHFPEKLTGLITHEDRRRLEQESRGVSAPAKTEERVSLVSYSQNTPPSNVDENLPEAETPPDAVSLDDPALTGNPRLTRKNLYGTA